FETSTKDVGPAKGLDMLKEIKRSAGIPVMAIGGITAETASGVIRAGADAIAVSGAVLNGDLLENARMLVGAIRP
nr:thiamine phosphate synthase [Nitrospiraceae bacterium]